MWCSFALGREGLTRPCRMRRPSIRSRPRGRPFTAPVQRRMCRSRETYLSDVRLRVFGDLAAVYLERDTAAALVILRLAAESWRRPDRPRGERIRPRCVVREHVRIRRTRAATRMSRPLRRAVRSTSGQQSRKSSMTSTVVPCTMPAAATLKWDSLRADPDGSMVIINRLRRPPDVFLVRDRRFGVARQPRAQVAGGVPARDDHWCRAIPRCSSSPNSATTR